MPAFVLCSCATTRAGVDAPARVRAEHHLQWFHWDVTLWEVAALADDIVVADVGERRVEDRWFESRWMSNSVTPIERWKGGEALREVGTFDAATCGVVYKPGELHAGSRAIVFSRRRDLADSLFGVRELETAQDLISYRKVLMRAIEDQRAGKVRSHAWMVLAASTRVTRWDGFRSLEMSGSAFTRDELRAIASAYVEDPATDLRTIEIAMNHLRGTEVAGLDAAFIRGLDGLFTEPRNAFRGSSTAERFLAARGCDRPFRPIAGEREFVQRQRWWADAKVACGLH